MNNFTVCLSLSFSFELLFKSFQDILPFGYKIKIDKISISISNNNRKLIFLYFSIRVFLETYRYVSNNIIPIYAYLHIQQLRFYAGILSFEIAKAVESDYWAIRYRNKDYSPALELVECYCPVCNCSNYIFTLHFNNFINGCEVILAILPEVYIFLFVEAKYLFIQLDAPGIFTRNLAFHCCRVAKITSVYCCSQTSYSAVLYNILRLLEKCLGY